MPDTNGQPDLRSIFDAKSTKERSERCTELVTAAFGGMKNTRAAQRRARAFMRGRISANLPPAIREAAIRYGDGMNQQTLEYHSPQSLIWPLKQVADFASQKPKPMRDPVARARESASVSTRIERIARGVMQELWPYRQSCDPVLLDSEAASWVIPSTAHWAEPVDQYDYCTPDEWARVSDDLKELWEWRPNEGDGNSAPGRYRRYARKYRRDDAGRPEWGDEYLDGKPFREDMKRSSEAVDEATEEKFQSKIPLQIDLLLPSQFAPVNPRWEGDRLVVDGIARREKLGGSDLYRRGYRWAKDGAALIPNEAMTSVAAVTLDSLMLQDGDGCPYLIYSVDGCRTWRQDGDRDFSESIDLNDVYGFDFLPVVYQLGLHTMSMNPDDWVIPYLEPLVTPSLMRDRLVAMNDFHVQNTSCGGWFVKIDPAIQSVMPELASKPEFRVKQMAATPVPGDIVPAVHPGAGPGLVVQKEMLDQDIMQAGPQSPTDAAKSGIDRALRSRDEDRGLSMAWDGVDALYAGTATNALRALACMARKIDKPMTLNLLSDMPDDDASSPTKSTVVVDADMFGGNYRIVAWRPDDWGSDPTKQAMLMEAQKNKQATFVEMREAVGDPDPMGTMAQIFVEDLLLNTPEGKSMVLEEEAKINADLQNLERAKLRRDQLLNQDNVPTGMNGGVIDPNAALVSQQPGSPTPGVTLDASQAAGMNPAQQQLNSVAGSPRAAVTGIANAGGDASGLDFGSGGA